MQVEQKLETTKITPVPHMYTISGDFNEKNVQIRDKNIINKVLRHSNWQ